MLFDRILIALDDSPVAALALEAGAELAKQLNADVALINIVDSRLLVVPDGGPAPDLIRADWERTGRALLNGAATRLGSVKPPWEFVGCGRPADEIVTAARQWGATLIVIGTHARTGVSRALLGSTAEQVLRHAPCPVMVVPPHPPADTDQ